MKKDVSCQIRQCITYTISNICIIFESCAIHEYEDEWRWKNVETERMRIRGDDDKESIVGKRRSYGEA